MNNATFDPKRVYLVSGQVVERKVGGREGRAPEVQQRVVVADDAEGAYKALAAQEPGFAPLGLASLANYEEAAANLRAVLAGDKTDWPLYHAA